MALNLFIEKDKRVAINKYLETLNIIKTLYNILTAYILHLSLSRKANKYNFAANLPTHIQNY